MELQQALENPGPNPNELFLNFDWHVIIRDPVLINDYYRVQVGQTAKRVNSAGKQ